MLTPEIIHSTFDHPLHTRFDEGLNDVWISSRSRWGSNRWDFDNATHGSKSCGSRVNWNIDLPNGRSLLDAEYATLLNWLRRFVWSLFVAPGDNATALKPGSVARVNAGLVRVVPWLVENSIRLPKELDRYALNTFRQDLPQLLATSNDDVDGDSVGAGIGRSVANYTVGIIYKLWQQRRALEDCGIEPMPERPWPEIRGAHTLALSVATEAAGWIQPLPDEIAVPLINRATWFLDAPADDAMRLQDALMDACDRRPGTHRIAPGNSTTTRARWQREACASFSFSCPKGEDSPWHPPLPLRKGGAGEHSALLQSLRLVKRVQTAAILTLQWSTGMRASELCGLRAGIDLKTGLPLSVQVQASSTGLNEEFLLVSELSKTEGAPRPVPWRLGMRPIGSKEIPIAVRALLILDRLLAPYRKLLETDRLLISISSSQGLPKTRDGVAKMTAQRINDLYRDFVAECVDLRQLPDSSAHFVSTNDLVKWRESNGRIITSHQVRKTFAQYVLSVDPRLLPAVKRQFHHISMAMTEAGYWGNNVLQIEPVHAVAAQQTAMIVFELATGRTKVAGKMGVQLELHIADLSKRLSGMGIEAGWREAVRWSRSNGLQITFGAHGGCFPANPSKMECWKRAGKRPLGNLAPNYSTREPGVCAGCSCFLIDARHIPFWESRYLENEVAYREAKARGDEASFRRVRDRAAQARAFLHHVGADLAELKRRVDQEANTDVKNI